jgi:hypothetical protein
MCAERYCGHTDSRRGVLLSRPRLADPPATGLPACQAASLGTYLPAALAPFVDVVFLFAQGRVVAVAGIEPGVVRQVVEDPRRHVVDQRREVLGRSRASHTTWEQRIASTVKKRRLTDALGVDELAEARDDAANTGLPIAAHRALLSGSTVPLRTLTTTCAGRKTHSPCR